MGLGIATVKLNIDMWQRGFFKDIHRVFEMGAQELYLKKGDFEQLIKMGGVPGYKPENFAALEKFPSGPFCPAKPFYDLLGISQYACADFSRQHGAIPIDLNNPLEDKSLYGQYDLVTDCGTNEHVFNTGEAYRTMHRLCRPGGLLIIIQTIYGGNGFYAYTPAFFENMAAANRYKILFSSFILDTSAPTPDGSTDQYHIPLSQSLLDMFEWNKSRNVGICYVMQKQSPDDFRLASQYYYETLHNYGYHLQYGMNPISREYVNIYLDKKVLLKVFLGELSLRIKRKFGLA